MVKEAALIVAWDQDGYAKMIHDAGFKIILHDRVSLFQVIMGTRDIH